MTHERIGYLQLLRTNGNYRRLWYSQLISNLGDWFNHVAIMVLLVDLTGSGLALGAAMIARFLPFFLLSPVAGVLADRFNRKTIMILADVMRGLVVLGFISIDQPGQIWLVYVLIMVQLSLSAIFEPARNAVMPTITTHRELLAANVIGGSTWSLMLAVGGLLGGVVVYTLGRHWAFMIDSATYFLSALCIMRVAVPPVHRRVDNIGWRTWSGLTDVQSGIRYIVTRPAVMWLISIKMMNQLCAGVMLLLVIMAERVFPIGGSASVSLGFLHGAWGIGAVLGPMLARRWAGEQPCAMRRSVGISLLVRGVFLALLGMSTTLWMALPTALIFMAAGSVLWVFSTTLLQFTVPDELRGRVFAAEWAFMTVALCLSNLFVGWGLDVPQWSPMFMSFLLAGLMLPPALIWIYLAFVHDGIFHAEETAGVMITTVTVDER